MARPNKPPSLGVRGSCALAKGSMKRIPITSAKTQAPAFPSTTTNHTSADAENPRREAASAGGLSSVRQLVKQRQNRVDALPLMPVHAMSSTWDDDCLRVWPCCRLLRDTHSTRSHRGLQQIHPRKQWRVQTYKDMSVHHKRVCSLSNRSTHSCTPCKPCTQCVHSTCEASSRHLEPSRQSREVNVAWHRLVLISEHEQGRHSRQRAQDWLQQAHRCYGRHASGSTHCEIQTADACL